jgi:hypothetical protein
VALKITLFFLQNGQGWSETYWNNESDPVALVNDNSGAGVATDSILVNRAKLLSPFASIVHLRASVDGNSREEYGVNYGLPGFPGQASRAFLAIVPAGPESILPPSIRVQVESGVIGPGVILKRKNYLGGVPADLMNSHGTFERSGTWNTVLQAFFLTGKHRPFAMRSRPRAADAVNIISFQIAADGLSAILGPDVALGVMTPVFQVNLRGIRSPHGWNGIHRATHVPNPLVPGANLIQIGPRRSVGVTVPPWAVGDGGTVGLTTPSFATLTNVAAEALVKKSTGRPFGVPRGRRSRP